MYSENSIYTKSCTFKIHWLMNIYKLWMCNILVLADINVFLNITLFDWSEISICSSLKLMNINEIKIKSVWSQSELTCKEVSRMSALLWPPHWPSRLAEGLKVISGCMWPLGAELCWLGGGLQPWGGPLWCNGRIRCCRGLWDWSVLRGWGVCDRKQKIHMNWH